MSRIAWYVKNSEVQLFYLLNRKIHCYLLDVVMRGVTHLGSIGFSIMFPIVLFLSNSQQTRQLGLQVALALSLSQIVVQLVKRMVNRPRPYKALENAIAVKPPSCKYSFPSGHTCAAFSMAFVLSNSIPDFGFVFLLLASLVGISRIYLGFHYPTDVLAGFGIAHISLIAALI